MLDPEVAGRIWREHFDNLTPEEFAATVKRASPDLAREMWGDRPAAEICAEHPQPVPRARGFFASLGRSVVRLFS